MTRPGEVPRDQWRARSKKSKVTRLHKMKQGALLKNLEKVENMQYKKERLERDRARLSEGAKPAGHHNLPAELLKPTPVVAKAKPAQGGAAARKQPLFPENSFIGIIRPDMVRKRLQLLFDVEKD
eukprot:Rhum_TRINITY_DN6983_c0_g1::Rhum_TRINITY_DN6983_c0_g1_i1::g.21407::m.21407